MLVISELGTIEGEVRAGHIVVAGRIQVLLADVPALQAQVREGTVRAIGITSAERLPILPELPTMAEAGLPGVVTETWYGLLAPAGVPQERLAVLSRAFHAAIAPE